MSEEWRPIPGFPGYEVSDLGRVRSLDRDGLDGRRLKGRVLRPGVSRRYRVVSLRRAGRTVTNGIHELVLLAFVGPRPEGAVTRHLNGDGADNRLVNLAYGTQSENLFDRREHGTSDRANRTHCPQGHEYTPENTYRYVRPNGVINRNCRECRRTVYRTRYHARKEGSRNG